MKKYFNGHNHTMYSNLRLLDSIIRPKDLINKAIELGLSGIAITDHECLCAHMEVNQYAKKLRETNPDFVIASCGDTPNIEAIACVSLLKKYLQLI